MEPKDLRDSVSTVHLFNALIDYWSESSRCSNKQARKDLVNNMQGDYVVSQKDGTWEFRNRSSGETARFKDNAWEFVGFGESPTIQG